MTTLIHPRSTLAQNISINWVTQAFAVYRERKALMRLDDAALQDIGITRQDALTEAKRPFWDIFVR